MEASRNIASLQGDRRARCSFVIIELTVFELSSSFSEAFDGVCEDSHFGFP